MFWVLKRTVSLRRPSHWDSSFEYPQHTFWLWNKKVFFSYALLTKVLVKCKLFALLDFQESLNKLHDTLWGRSNFYFIFTIVFFISLQTTDSHKYAMLDWNSLKWTITMAWPCADPNGVTWTSVFVNVVGMWYYVFNHIPLRMAETCSSIGQGSHRLEKYLNM